MATENDNHWKREWRPTSQVRILSIDGGGVRGIIPAYGLVELESCLGQKQTTVHGAFDWFIGTSTGSLIAAALALGGSAAQIRDLYRKDAREIFPNLSTKLRRDWYEAGLSPLRTGGMLLPKHGDRGLNRVLQRIFPERKLKDIKTRGKRLLIVAYSAGTRQPLVFDSDSEAHAEIPIWQACRASSAAQTFLPEYEMRIGNGETVTLLDGGTVANNPVAIAVCRALACRLETESAFVVSLGTGQNERGYSPLRWIKLGGFLPWASTIVQTFMSGSNRTFENLADNLLQPDKNHFRFDVPLWLARSGLDDARDAHLNALEQDSRAYWSQDLIKQRLKHAVEKLDGKPRPDLSSLKGMWCGIFTWEPHDGDDPKDGRSAEQTITIDVVSDAFVRGESKREDPYPGTFEAGIIGVNTLVGQWYNLDKTRASTFVLTWKSATCLTGHYIGYGDATPLYQGTWTLKKS